MPETFYDKLKICALALHEKGKGYLPENTTGSMGRLRGRYTQIIDLPEKNIRFMCLFNPTNSGYHNSILRFKTYYLETSISRPAILDFQFLISQKKNKIREIQVEGCKGKKSDSDTLFKNKVIQLRENLYVTQNKLSEEEIDHRLNDIIIYMLTPDGISKLNSILENAPLELV